MDPSSVAGLRRVDRTRFDAWLARIIGALLIAILITAPLLMGALRDQDFAWIQILGVVAAALWLVRLWLDPRTIVLPPIVWPLVAFCIYAIVRYFTSEIEYLARKEVVRVLFYMMFFVIALNHFQNAKLANIAVSILLALGMALSVYALRQYLTGTNVIWNLVRPGYAFRGSGTFIYPNNFAGWSEMVLALGLAYVFLGTLSPWGRIFLAYCCLWLTLGIYFSFSRAGWMATTGSLFLLLAVFLRNRQRQIIAFALLVVLLIAGLAWELKTHEFTKRLKDVGSNDPITGFNVRRALWTGAYHIWRDHPFWGGGPGHFDERFRAYRTRYFQWRAGYAHCDYLNVLADWGAVGATLLLVAIILYVASVAPNWFKTLLDPTPLNAATTNRFAITCGGFAGTIALLAHSLVDYQWYMPGVMLTFIAIVAMVLSQLQTARWNFAARLPVSMVIAALMLFQAIQAGKTLREHHWLDKANAASSMNERIADLERALQIEPTNFQTAYSIGESYRALSWDGGPDYRELAEKAIPWLDRAARLNRFDSYPPMRKAMCLDWLKRHAEAETEIRKALALDPEYYLVLAIAGWHYYQLGDDVTALKYLIASHDRNWRNNPIVMQYLRLAEEHRQAKAR